MDAVSFIMFIVFLLIGLSTVGIYAFIYSGKEQYSEGMVLGVHIPAAQTGHEEVRKLTKQYQNNFRRFNLCSLLTGILVCLPCFWNIAYAIIIWTLWLLAYLALGYGLIYIAHRKLYDIKMKYNWIMEENTRVIHIDTVVSSMSDKLPISHIWNLPAVIATGLLVSFAFIGKGTGIELVRWLFPAVGLPVTFLFWGIHLWVTHRKNIVYSRDSSVNMALNRRDKRTWSVFVLSANYLNLSGLSYLMMELIRNHWLYALDYWIYIILQMLPVFVIVFANLTMQIKRKEMLAFDSSALIVDDDEFWKNGWYSNPKDTHLFVQDRMCNINYSMNMAKPAAKVFTAVTAVVLAVIITAVCYFSLSLGNVKITFRMEGDQVTVKAATYNTHFNVSEIKAVKIRGEIFEDSYIRTNGASTDQYLIGRYKGRTSGKCMMFLYRKYSPVLEIDLADDIIYINSKNKDDIEEWYRILLKTSRE